MTIREATPADKSEIIDLYIRSQAVTGLPDPNFIPPHDLGNKLYSRAVIARFVYDQNNKIISHGHIEEPNAEHILVWRQAIEQEVPLMELGGAFVHPEFSSQGIWTRLLEHRIGIVRSLGAAPVAATWRQNEHVKKVFTKLGAIELDTHTTHGGEVSLFAFVE